MKITRCEESRLTFEEWCAEKGIELEAKERKGFPPGPMRWYVSGVRVEVIDGCLLKGTFGNGATPAEALANYEIELQGKQIGTDYRRTRKKLWCPAVWGLPK